MSAAAAKRRALAAASILALLTVLIVGSAGADPRSRDRVAPTAPANVHVVKATPFSVYVGWDPAQDDVAVAGYYVYGDSRKATVVNPSYMVSTLGCGEGSALSVVAFDRAGNRSPRVMAVVATAACPDTRAPSTPSGFKQLVTTRNAVVLAWSPSTDDVGVVGYGVFRGMSKVSDVAEPTVALNGLACDTTYSYLIDAVDAAGNRSLLGTAYVRTAACADSSPPSAPSNLAVTGRTETSISVAWTAASDDVGVAGYRVSVGGAPVASATTTSATLTGLACGKNYTIAVDAYDGAGNRSPAATLAAGTAACPQALPAPTAPPAADTNPPTAPATITVANVTQTAMDLQWTPSADDVGVTSYDVYRNSSNVGSATTTTYRQSALSCGTTYRYEVVARDAAGNASPPASASAATSACSTSTPTPTPTPPPPTPAPSADTAPPSQPTGLAVSGVTRTSVSLTWASSTDNVAVTGYRTLVNGSAAGTAAQPGTTVSSLQCGTGYTFAVEAYDAAGNRSSRASLVASTSSCPDTQPPSAPTNVVATNRTATSIALGWSASSDNVGVAGYGLYRGGASAGTSSTTNAVLTGLACNTNYTLAVDAHDAAGNRSSQTVVMVSTTACPDTSPPTAPTSLAASNITQTGVSLTWKAANDNVGVTGYDVYRNGTKMTTATTLSASQSGLACATSYTFGVIARDAAGNSSPMTQLNVTTSACAAPAPAPAPPPPSTSTTPPYFVADYANGTFGSPWTTLFSYSSPGWVDVRSAASSGSPDGRVKVVPAPGSGGGNAARMEIRDSDPGWASSTSLQKSEVRTVPEQTFNKAAVSVGDVRWFSTRIYLPYTATEKFEWAHGGSNAFTCLIDLHPESGTAWPAFSLQWYPASSDQWATFRAYGGDASNPNQNAETIKLWQLTDGSGSRVMSNHNRWIDLVWGMRFAADSTGWLEVWVDGANVYPRKNRPTMWSGDSGQYFKMGLYKQKDASFPESGRSVVYYGRTTIGTSKP